MRLGKEQGAGYVEDTGSLESTGSGDNTVPVENTGAEAPPAKEPVTAQGDGMPLTTPTGPALAAG